MYNELDEMLVDLECYAELAYYPIEEDKRYQYLRNELEYMEDGAFDVDSWHKAYEEISADIENYA